MSHIMYDCTLNEVEESEAIEYASGICSDWETRTVEKLPTHSRFVSTSWGIDIHYDFGADYYFFVVNDNFVNN